MASNTKRGPRTPEKNIARLLRQLQRVETQLHEVKLHRDRAVALLAAHREPTPALVAFTDEQLVSELLRRGKWYRTEGIAGRPAAVVLVRRAPSPEAE